MATEHPTSENAWAVCVEAALNQNVTEATAVLKVTWNELPVDARKELASENRVRSLIDTTPEVA
jgi:hypothetical protein